MSQSRIGRAGIVSIRLEQVSAHHGDRPLLRDCSLLVAEGERFVLLGPEGSGKNSLLRVIAGTIPADHGRVLLFGRDVTRTPAGQRLVGIVYRQPALFNRKTLLENVEFALGMHLSSAPARRRNAEELLALTGLADLATRYPAQVSDAEQYRAAMARALGHDPRILLLEARGPAQSSKDILELRLALDQVRRRFGTTVILATTDPQAAMQIGDSIGMMSAGRLLEVGDPESLYLRPRTRFTAFALGTANLLPGLSGREGVRVGEQLFSLGDTGCVRSIGGDVTVLVRPEDIAVAASPTDLPVQRAGDGVIERVEMSGLVQRLIIRSPSLLPDTDLAGGVPSPSGLVACRSAAEAQASALVPGEGVAIGIRRIHVLPTQLCSLWITDAAGGAVESLAGRRTVRELSASMQLPPRPVSSLPSGSSIPATALCVVSGWGPRGMDAVWQLLERGARQVLLVREADRPATQMLMWADGARAAREHMLSISASLLRYLPMEASMLVSEPRRGIRGGRYRMLLELRRAALEQHGIDMRTEFADPDPMAGVVARLRRAEQQFLMVVGLKSPRAARQMLDRVAALEAVRQLGAVLVTCACSRQDSPAGAIPSGQRDVA
jgi:sulfate/thiosulfate transport system ATP-binding protein